jgi:adenylate cyclase
VDKFIGDSVMAFWNAPTSNPHHALSACKAALECQAAFRQSPIGARAGLRIGINSGATLVGNIGSSNRLNYTAIGDVVNVASRLESLNKRYGTGILVGEATADAAGAAAILRRVDKVAVYGRRGGQWVHELLALAEDRPGLEERRWVETYEAGLGRYLRRDWEAATECFRQADRMRGGDPPSQHMMARCSRYMAAPPPADWDGTDMAESK